MTKRKFFEYWFKYPHMHIIDLLTLLIIVVMVFGLIAAVIFNMLSINY